MRLELSLFAASAASIIGFVPCAFAAEPGGDPSKPFDYKALPGVYAISSAKHDAKCPKRFTLRADGTYSRVSTAGAVERGTATKLKRSAEGPAQPFALKSSGGRKSKIGMLPSNNGVAGALIGFEAKAGTNQGPICGYLKDDPASRAMMAPLPADQTGRVEFTGRFDFDQIYGAYVEVEPKPGNKADKACGHTLEIDRKGGYVRFLSGGKRENGTYTMEKRKDDQSGQVFALTTSKGKKYRIGILPSNHGNPSILAMVATKDGTNAICGFARVARF